MQDIVDRFVAGPAYQRLSQRRLILTVTSGRSGTGLLAALLEPLAGVHAVHEADPRANIIFRNTIHDPRLALQWLVEHKLPTIDRTPHPIYVETSHMHCKGFIELFLGLGLRPEFILLRRDARLVARSLYAMDVIPGRSINGRMVLLGPDDLNVLPLPAWESYSDYQLCYWYAREIERRQALYRGVFDALSLPYIDITIEGLRDWTTYKRLARFVQPRAWPRLSRAVYDGVIGENQNPRDMAHPGHIDREFTGDIDEQEHAIDAACAPYFGQAAIAALSGSGAQAVGSSRS